MILDKKIQCNNEQDDLIYPLYLLETGNISVIRNP